MAASNLSNHAADAYIVWEFQSDIPGLFAPYADIVSNFIEQEYMRDPFGQVNLGKASPTLTMYDVEFSTNLQISVQNASQRSIRRQTYFDYTTIGSGIVWEWMTDNGWLTYHVEAIEAIEKAFTQHKKEVDLENFTHGLPNVVLIQKGYQKNKYSGFYRPIQRRACNYLMLKSNTRNTNLTPAAYLTPAALGTKPKTSSKQKTPIERFCRFIQSAKEGEDCVICLLPLNDEDEGASKSERLVELKKCKHTFHESCMGEYCKQVMQGGCIQCPYCKKIHGVKTGIQPPGRMNVSINKQGSVKGYPGKGMITISYNIQAGIQGPEHPNPGQPYQTYGFPRTAYLPANNQGRKVLKLLQKAWERRLIFTVGQSTTTGIDNAVIWNEIHHKTSPYDDHSGHGYPDPKYLDNVTEELRLHGVTEGDEESDDEDQT